MSRTADVLIGAGLLAFGGLLLLWGIPNFVGKGDQAILPTFVAVLISVLAASLIAARLLGREQGDGEPDPFIETGGGEPLAVVLLAVTWCCFLFTTEALGFYVGGGAALAASFLILGVRGPIRIGGWIAGTLIVVYLVFEGLMSLTLPRGILGAWLGG